MAWTKVGSLKGPKGDTGETGAPGKDGTGVTIKGSFADMEALQSAHPSGEAGDAYMLEDTGHLAVWNGSQWQDVGQIKGDKGDTGPKGDPGEDGAAATVTVGTVTTGEPGTEAAVVNGGTSSAAVLNFTIPEGAAGAQGPAGQDGAPGEKGDKGDKGDPGEPGTKVTVVDGQPSEAGAAGDVAIDSATGDLYVFEE